ncbi:MAG: putative tail completion protein [Prokaryotic dsDNA virus sp.]|jgi:hypothetical protein|nr:MAG: putative tail completion protein [Prokaryotic dsDNA virus sp.]|tara:strand:- start:46 stop:732 length:687 start_codon:yes stop_codon:yes gene_type:complete
MPLSLTIDQDLSKATAWTKAVQKQLPFATSVAINNAAFDARKAINAGTKSAFHVPVKFTQSAFLVQKSKKRELTAFVYAQDKKGKDRARYLRFGIAGGTRPQKGMDAYFENAVPNDGTIPAGAYFMPTSLVKTNASGNVTQATLRRISKGINGDARGGFFIGTPRGGNRPPGIYRRSRQQLQPYFIATTDRPDYTGRFNIESIGAKVIQRRFGFHFNAALSKAVSTAK